MQLDPLTSAEQSTAATIIAMRASDHVFKFTGSGHELTN